MIFWINKYTLLHHVVSLLSWHCMNELQFTCQPVLVLKSFGLHGMQVKLMATMFQNLLPSINKHKGT